MDKEIERLINLSFAKSIEIEILKKELEGFLINRQVVLEILKELTNK